MTNKVHDAFDEVKASEELKASARQFLAAEREKRELAQEPVHSRPVWGRTLAAVCAAFILVFGLGALFTTQQAVSFVSIDVNPSIELSLNRYDRVVSAAAYNDDGEIVLKDVSVKGKKYAEAIDEIVESKAMHPYLKKDAALTFTVAGKNSKKEAAVKKGIENCSGCRKYRAQSCTADVASIEKAHENGLSFGKYKAYLTLAEYDGTVTVDDCKNMTMAEINGRICEEKGSCTDGQHSRNGQGGSQHQSGSGQHSGEHGKGKAHGKD